MDDAFSGLNAAFDYQVAGCEAFGSPFSARALRIMQDDIRAGGPFASLVAPWKGQEASVLVAGVMPLRLLGGLHYLALSGRAPRLAAEFPTARPDTDEAALRREIIRAGADHAAILAGFTQSPPQTNEVRRSICLLGGFLTVARETGLPLRCLEIGASAGLNLNWDRFFYDLGPQGAWGDPSSPLRIDAEWTGAPPPFDVAAKVAERAGCDQSPIDVSDPDQALRLQAYVWADQAERLARVRAAIDIARRFPPAVEAADAGDWVARMAPPKPGVATVIYHSVVWFYLSAETREAVRSAILRAGEAASADAPLAWLRMEAQSLDPAAMMGLRLTAWPGGQERVIAEVHPHGAKVSWLGG
jgi:hypothetical protein